MRVALDTNVLAYAEGINGAERRGAALDLVHRLPQEATVIPVQVLGELYNVLVRKAGKSRSDAREGLLNWRDTFPVERQDGRCSGCNEHLDAAGDAGLSANEACAFEGENHLVD